MANRLYIGERGWVVAYYGDDDYLFIFTKLYKIHSQQE
jgi:hypothetical protein